MQITLVTSPLFDHSTYYANIDAKSQPYLPLGLLALAAYLLPHGIEVDIADLNIAFNDGRWKNDKNFYQTGAEILESYNSNILGFLTASDAYHHTVNIAKQYKMRNPETPIILGGYQASVADTETVKYFSFIDAVVRGEGEYSLLKIVESFQKGHNFNFIPGVTYRENDKVVINEDVELIKNLDDLPIPAYDLYPISTKNYVYLEIGRGCPYRCSYCSTAPFWRRRTRNKSTQRVINEIEFLNNKYGFSQFHFVHDLFTVYEKWVYELCNKVKDNNLEIKWTCSARVDTVSDKLLKIMADAGCVGIYYGVETGSEMIQKRINKTINLEKAEKVIRKTLDCGIMPIVGFITGFPFETKEAFSATISEFIKYKQAGVPLSHIFAATPEKGSDLYKSHFQDIYFPAHFLDFPLSQDLRKNNLKLMRDYPEIFTGFYRFKNEQFEPEVFKGIDEFSPLINTIGFPVILALSQIKDAAEFYLMWLEWLSKENTKNRKLETELYYGTLQNMIDFIRYLQNTDKIQINCLNDTLAYENIKNEYRINISEIQKKLETMKTHQINDYENILDWKPTQSPFNKIETFNYDIKRIYHNGLKEISKISPEPTNILFYVSLLSMANITDYFKELLVDIISVKVDNITKIILEMCDGNADVGNIIIGISTFCKKELSIDETRVKYMILERIKRLHNQGIISFHESHKELM